MRSYFVIVPSVVSQNGFQVYGTPAETDQFVRWLDHCYSGQNYSITELKEAPICGYITHLGDYFRLNHRARKLTEIA